MRPDAGSSRRRTSAPASSSATSTTALSNSSSPSACSSASRNSWPGRTRTRSALLRRIQSQASNALEDLRDLARGIYPPVLADQGLTAALQAQARKASLPVTIESDGIGRFSRDVEAAVYFCVLEALNNAAKYAEASVASVRLSMNGGLRFEVADDGRGFDTGKIQRGTGLQGMADRLEAVGGELEIRSRPGAGTMVIGRLPQPAPSS